jgi:tetrapyrrole methylase family protein/MazG family protein
VGFDWPHNITGLQQVFAKITEEVEELREALAHTQQHTETDAAPAQSLGQEQVEAELGDILFSLVNLARFIKVNPEEALRRATNRFIDRFQLVEVSAAQQGRALQDMTLAEMNQLWEKAKQQLNNSQPHASQRHEDHTS